MPQILKDDVRDNILNSAKEEFQEYGFEKSSMRRIAFKSKMTVGNLYRYFKSKEDLNEFIVSPVYNAINKAVERLSGGKLCLGCESTGFSASPEELKQMLNTLSDNLVDIHKKHRIELNILMMGSRLNKELTEWFVTLVSQVIVRNYPILNIQDERVVLMSKCYADAIFSGIRTILRNWSGSEEDLRLMIKIHLNSYLSILGQDLMQLV